MRVFLGASDSTAEARALLAARWDRLSRSYDVLPPLEQERLEPFYEAAKTPSGPAFDAYGVAIRTGVSTIGNREIQAFVEALDALERELNQAPFRQPPLVLVVPEGSDIDFDPGTGFTTALDDEPGAGGDPDGGAPGGAGSDLATIGLGVGILGALALGAWAVIR